MKIKQFVVDAFTDRLFAGNPAAVCVLEAPLSDARMQAVAIENNLSETAFLEKRADGKYGLRWFTPGGEIDLCGHATPRSARLSSARITSSLTPIASLLRRARASSS